MSAPHELWPSCGYRYLTITQENRLDISTDFLRHLLQRPELVPIEESCAEERRLHRQLMDEPSAKITMAELAQIADLDARENYQIILQFRDLLLNYGSIEAAYLALTGGKTPYQIPIALVDVLVQVVLRHILMAQPDAYKARAAELFFRRQQVSLEGGIMLADSEAIQRRQPTPVTVLQSLIQQAGGIAADRGEPLETLNKSTLSRYGAHSENFELILSLNQDEPGIEALCRVMELWLRHFHDLTVQITPLREINDEHWRWHIGLDAHSNAILNKLYQGRNLDTSELRQLLVLFRLEFADPSLIQPDMANRPVYLAIAMDEENSVRLKPQNLLLNLPLAQPI